MLTFGYYFINIYYDTLCYYHVDINNKCCLSEVINMVESILGVFKSIAGIFNAFFNFLKDLFGSGKNDTENEKSNQSFHDILGKTDLG